MRNARCALHFWRMSRTKRWPWRLGASLLEEVSYATLVLETWRSYETLILETWRFTFGGSLVRNARFGNLAFHFWRKSRVQGSLWRLGASLLEDVSYETLVLETWRFTCGAGLRRGQFVVQRERAFRSWAQKWPVCSTYVVRDTAKHAGVNVACRW